MCDQPLERFRVDASLLSAAVDARLPWRAVRHLSP